MPGVISWPKVVQGPRVSWDPVVTMDFLPTVMEILGVQRPEQQRNWHFDGISVLPILQGKSPQPRGIGWMYDTASASSREGYAYRYGKWKYVVGGISCDPQHATFDCSKPQLYDMSTDYAENNDLSSKEPEVLKAIAANFSLWHATILDSQVLHPRTQPRAQPASLTEI